MSTMWRARPSRVLVGSVALALIAAAPALAATSTPIPISGASPFTAGCSGHAEPGTNFRAWFFKILTNCYFSKRRREKSRPVTSDLDDTPDLYLYARSAETGFPVQGPDPAAQLLDQLGTERVVAAIGRLPDEYRVVATLYFMEDLSYEEIAQVLACPIGTVRSRLHRGRKMLQKALWQVAEESGIISHHPTGAGA